MIDHLTRFSAGYVCKSKAPKEILRGVFQCWIAIFGSPQKFLTDNGGEFGNKEFLEMAEQMNVRVLTTAAMSPWSNGLVERHNATLSETLYRIMENKDIDIETALAWAISAKNSLESYCFNAKQSLEYDKVKDKVNEADKTKVLEACNETIQWMDSNQLAEKEEFDHRQKELEKICAPILSKLYQSTGGSCDNPAPGASQGPSVEEVD